MFKSNQQLLFIPLNVKINLSVCKAMKAYGEVY
jgi:hypothetical protein